MEFVRNANAWRKGIGKKYLHMGKMVKPYNIKCEKQIIHYVRGKDRYFDEVYTSAWTDGVNVAQFLINYNNRNVGYEIDLPEGEYNFYENNKISRTISGGKYKGELKPFAVAMIENIQEESFI